MNNVTRFIGSKSWYSKSNNVVLAAAFYTNSNRREGEVSVFDIDKELEANQEEKIFELGDKKVYKKKPYTLARADIKVANIIKIKTNNEFLRVDKGFMTKHCNIRPFPSNDALALNVAGQLARISQLVVRARN